MTSSTAPSDARAGSSGAAGFTLIELVVVLTVLAVITAAAVPSFRILQDERAASRPMDDVLELVREVRQRVINENRPYQIIFSENRVTATRLINPYMSPGETERYLAELTYDREPAPADRAPYREYELSPFSGSDRSEDARREPPWTKVVALPDDVQVAVRGLNDYRPVVLGSSAQRTWIIQPGGLADPLTVSFIRGGVAVQLSFDALTNDFQSSSNYEG